MTERKFRWTHPEGIKTELNEAMNEFKVNIKNIKPRSKNTTAIAIFINACEYGDYVYIENSINYGFDGCEIASKSIRELFGRFVHVNHSAFLECVYQVVTEMTNKRLFKPGELA